MTTAEAILAMRIGCKIRADWMKPELFYYIQDGVIRCNDNWPNFMDIERFSQVFDESHEWYIV